MKKFMTLAAALLLASGGIVLPKGELVSIDSLVIMQKSAEGKEIASKIQKDVDRFQEDLKNSQKDLGEMQEELSKQSKVLSKDALQEKTEEINQKRKKLEREFAEKEEALRLTIQKKQVALRDRQLAVVNEVFEREGWGAVLDKNTPGLLCANSGIDRTSVILKAVDEKYQSSKAKPVAVAKATTNKTAKAS